MTDYCLMESLSDIQQWSSEHWKTEVLDSYCQDVITWFVGGNHQKATDMG
jgi:hypothetical protein